MATYRKRGKEVVKIHDSGKEEWLSPKKSQHYADISGGWRYLPDYKPAAVSKPKPVARPAPVARKTTSPLQQREARRRAEIAQRKTSTPVVKPKSVPVKPAAPTVQPVAMPERTEPAEYASIKAVFGEGWKPASIFAEKGLISKGVYGAVRIKGTQDVYTIGKGGRKETAESYRTRFGTDSQKGIVGEITADQARKLGIQVPVSDRGRIDFGNGEELPVTVIPKKRFVEETEPTAEAEISTTDLAGLGERFGVEGVGEMPTFREGLTTEQRTNIETLVKTKPQSQWSDKDWEDYQWATELSPTQKAIQSIQTVFGEGWTPAPIFAERGLIERGIVGAVRITGMNDVYTLGGGGGNFGKGAETAESYKTLFGTSSQKGIVGEISMEQAKSLGIVITEKTLTSDLDDIDITDLPPITDLPDDTIEPINPEVQEEDGTVIPIEIEDSPEVKAEKIKKLKEKAKEEAEVQEHKKAFDDAADILIKDIEDMPDKIKEAREDKEKELLMTEKSDKITAAEENFAIIETKYNSYINSIKDRLAPMSAIYTHQARARGQAAIELAGLAAIIDVAQGAYDRADKRVSDYMADWREGKEWSIKAAQMKLDMLGRDLTEAQQEAKDNAQIAIDMYVEDYNRVAKTQDQVKQMMLAYPEAKLNINMTWDEAYRKTAPFIKSEKDFNKRIALLSVEAKELDLQQAEDAVAAVAMGGLKTGGTRSWRNNNPGNIEYGDFAKSMGAVGTDGRFAKFATEDEGWAAMEALLKGRNYTNLTVEAAMKRWSGQGYGAEVARTRIDYDISGRKMNELSQSELEKLMDAMRIREGWKIGNVENTGKVEDYFSDTQINKGAANAGMSIEEFKQLDPDVANSYVYPSEEEKEKIFLSEKNMRKLAIAVVKKMGVEDAMEYIKFGTIKIGGKEEKLTQSQINLIINIIAEEYPEGRTWLQKILPFGK